ncbi:MAG: hypothetical protein ACFCU9_05010 [Cyanophyceae cyanobacterium]
MGTSYSAIPVDEEAATWLRSKNLPLPDSFGLPASNDQLREVLQSFDDYVVSIVQTNDGWDAEITGNTIDGLKGYTTMWVRLTGSDGRCTYHFHKGWPEIAIQVLHRIALIAGPQLFVPHDTGEPVVVDANSTMDDTIAALRATYR